MKILALEFSSAQRSVAALDGERVCSRAATAAAHIPTALSLLEKALAEAGWEREWVECIAVGLGPGSYTGIRIAIAVAQGWQFAKPVQLVGIGAADCLAAQLRAEGFRGRATLAIDAQRGEFYLTTCILDPAAPQTGEPLHLVTLQELRERRAQGEHLVGPELDRWIGHTRSLFPDAAALGRLAVQGHTAAAGQRLEPIYLRETHFVKAPPPRIRPGANGLQPRPETNTRASHTL
jgi:tRNA threonylcarbamoyladenosine biosynthesis protein TsaB